MDADFLIRTLNKYDASFDAAVIKTALHHGGHADNPEREDSDAGQGSGPLATWAAAHVTPDTLLSVDELNQ